MKRLQKYIAILVGIWIGGIPFSSAQVSLSLVPVEGGNSIRFGRVSTSSHVNKEVRVRMTSTSSTQYQVYHRILEPLVNTQGERLDLNAITLYTIGGSNAQGSLYYEYPAIVTSTDTLLYTSNQTGLSDTFTAVYSFNGEKINASGSFYGKALFTVRPIGGGAETEQILNIYAEVTDEFKVSVSTLSGQERIRLATDSELARQQKVKISFQGNLGAEIKIYQQCEIFPRDETIAELGQEVIRFEVEGVMRGKSYVSGKSFLSRTPQLLVTSGAVQDTITILYDINKELIETLKAGIYRGKINFIIESHVSREVIPIDLEVTVTPVFELELVMPPEGIRFNDLLPNADPQLRELTVKIKSNIKKPYLLMQNMQDNLTNERGEKIENSYFTLKEEFIDSSQGKLRFPEFTAVPLGDVPIYFSNEQGSPTEIRVIYRLEPYSGMQSGSYATVISFSLAER